EAGRPALAGDANSFSADSKPLARAIEHAEDDRLERDCPPFTRVLYVTEPPERSLEEDGGLLRTTGTRECTSEPVFGVDVHKRSVARRELARTLGGAETHICVTAEVARLNCVTEQDSSENRI